MSIEELKAAVKVARDSLYMAEQSLKDFEALAENNVYDSVEAAGKLKYLLEDLAAEDCEGSNCCGEDAYEQEFIVGGIVHVARLEVEYGCHDKTCYYIESSEFSVRVKG